MDSSFLQEKKFITDFKQKDFNLHYIIGVDAGISAHPGIRYRN